MFLFDFDQVCFFFFSSRRRHTRCSRDWSSDVCSSDLPAGPYTVNENGAANFTTPPNALPNNWTGPGQIFCEGQPSNSVMLVSGLTKICTILNVATYCTP